ncbi:MAG TPA: contractile injection system tape measure protein, partial [Candidatus Angelobacter sp.]
LPFLMQLVLPQAAEQHQLLHEAVERFAASAKDKRTFYSRLITAVLEKQPLDLEEFVGTGPGHPQPAPSSLPEDPAAWEAHALKSVMLSRLRSADFESDTYPPQPELLQALVSKHPQEGRHFLHVLRSRPAQLSSVVEHCPAALVVPILKLARPADAAMIDSLMQALSRVGSNHRPSGEDAVRRTILAEVLQLPPGEDMGQDFFARVLEKLFEVPLADPICRELRRQVAEIRSSNRFPTPQIDALDSTIETASSPDALARLTREKNCTSIPFTPASLGPMPAAREAVFSFLLGETRRHSLDDRDPGVAGTSEPCSLEQYSVDTLQHELQAMIEEAPQELRAVTERYIKDAEKRERWTTILPESSLAGLVRLLEPRKHRALLDTAEVLAAAWQEAASPSMPESTRNFMWSFLFDFLARNRETDRSTARMIGAFFEHVAQHAKGTAAGQAALAAMGSSLLESCARLARASGRSHLLSILARNRRLLRPFGNPSAPPPSSEDPGSLHGNKARSQPARGPVRDRTAFTLGRDVSEGGAADAIYIANAGLVLAGTFLPHLFESLNLLDDDASGRRRIRSGEAASRAVHLLQYLADGSCSTPEPLLVLNKIMCGLALETPVSREIELNDHERDLCEQLLRAMIANWSVISNTSIAGLRETFLQREGKLEHAAEGWRLQIQRKTLDILVDQISWSMSVIYHRWMLEPLYVKW